MGSSPPSPLMMVDILGNEFYSLAEKRVVNLGHSGADAVGEDGATVVGSSHGWLALFKERSLEVFLWNPISGERVNLPSIDKLPIPEDNLKSGHGCVSKVIVSSSSVGEEWRAVMSYGHNLYRLAFCCPVQSSTEWTTIGALTNVGIYDDFTYSSRLKRLFCVTTMYGYLERWDLRDPLSPRIDCTNYETEDDDEDEDEDDDNDEDEDDDDDDDNDEDEDEDDDEDEGLINRHMVVAEQSNEVFVVVKNIKFGDAGSNVRKYSADITFKTVGFDVYKIVMEGTKLSESYMEDGSLNGLAMFIGINHSFSLPAADYPGLNPDSIYFSDDAIPPTCTSTTKYGYGGNEVGIFDYKNKTFDPCYFPSYHVDAITKLTPLPVWFTPTTTEITSSKL